MLAHAIAVAADVDDVAVMDEPVDERGGHDLVAEDLAPLLEALVAGEHGRRVFVAATHQLKEELRAGARDRQIADLVDDHEARRDERAEAPREVARPAARLRAT